MGHAVSCPQCGHELTWIAGAGWTCGRCGFSVAPPEDDGAEDDFETVGELWEDEQRRIRSMSRPGGRSSGRRRKYRRAYAPPQPLQDDEETVRLRVAGVKKLPLRLRRQYVIELQRRYAEARTKREKSAIISEMVALGYNRSRARWRLRTPFRNNKLAVDADAVLRTSELLRAHLTELRAAS